MEVTHLLTLGPLSVRNDHCLDHSGQSSIQLHAEWIYDKTNNKKQQQSTNVSVPYHAKFQIQIKSMEALQTLLDFISTMQGFKSYSSALLMYMVLLQTLLDFISTMQSFKSYSCTRCYCKPY